MGNDFLVWFQGVWAPKRTVPIGSLYDIFMEDDQRRPDVKQLKRTLLETKVPRNDAFESHETIMQVFATFKFALWDALRQLNLNQRQLYLTLSLWVGRSRDVGGRSVDLSKFHVSEALQNLIETLRSMNLEGSALQHVLTQYFAPISAQIQSMHSTMENLSKLMKSHLRQVTPIMQIQSRGAAPAGENRWKKERKRLKRISKKASQTSSGSIYDTAYGGIVTEKSTSVMAWTVSTGERTVPLPVRRSFWSALFSKTCFCSSKNDTEEIVQRKFTIRNDKKVPHQNGAEDLETGNLRQAVTANGIEAADSIKSTSGSVTHAHDFALPVYNEPPTISGDMSKVKIAENDVKVMTNEAPSPNPSISEELANGNTLLDEKAVLKDLSTLTFEDISLENTQQHPESLDPNSALGVRDFAPLDDAERLSASFSAPAERLKAILFKISEIVSQVEKRYFSPIARFIKFHKHPNMRITFGDIMRILVENVIKMDVIPCRKIYADEEAALVNGIKQVYLETLKCSELFGSLTSMLLAAKTSLLEIQNIQIQLQNSENT